MDDPQKINHVWCNPENMETPALIELQESCIKQLERTQSDLEAINKVIGQRALEGAQ